MTIGDPTARKRKASVSDETFDNFLAEQGMLKSAEDHAVKELIAEQLATPMAEKTYERHGKEDRS